MFSFKLILIIYLLFTFNAINIHDEENYCFNIIKSFAQFDVKFFTRVEKKYYYSNITSSPFEFNQVMKKQHENGTTYSCGMSVSWNSEIYEGLENQYYNHKFKENDIRSGYQELYGGNVTELFKKYKNDKDGHIFIFRLTGTHDHVFLIEQIKNNKGNKNFYLLI
jgi:hypothetical protein